MEWGSELQGSLVKFICWVNIFPVPRCSWYSFSFQVRSEKRRGDKHKKEEVISIVAKGMLGFVSDMGSPDQCLESFENRQRDAQASAPAALAADIIVHPDQRQFRNVTETSFPTL